MVPRRVKREMRMQTRELLDVVGVYTVGVIQVNTPVDLGFLRQSNGHRLVNYRHLRIFNNAEYAPFIELGTGIHSTQPGGRTTPWVYKSRRGYFWTQGQRPNPFFRTGFKQAHSGIKQIMGAR